MYDRSHGPHCHTAPPDPDNGDGGLTPSLRTLRSMDDYRFEQFVADLWTEMGYRTTVRPPSRDGGIDVLARKRGPGGATEAIQAKRYEESTAVSGPDIQQYFAMKYQVGADEGVIVTTGRFTDPAEDRAAELGVGLVDGPDLVRLIDRHASVEFYHTYRDELGVDDDTTTERLSERARRGPRELARHTLARTRGTVEIRLGTAVRATGRRLRTARTTLRRAGTRLRGYEPALWPTEAGGRDDGSGSEWGAALEATGVEMVERGFDRQEPPVVGWRLPARSIVPLTGVSPSVRGRRAAVDRAVSVVVAVAALLALLTAVVGTGVGNARTASLVSVVALPVSGAGVAGIALATGLYSSSVIGLPRIVYAVPVVAGIAIRLESPATDPASIGWGLVAAGCLAFVAHTAVIRRQGAASTWTVDNVPVAYAPVFEPATVYGLTGSVVVAAALAAESLGMLPAIPGANGRVAAAVVACSLCAVLVDAAGRVVRGGVIGTAAGGILLGYLLLGGRLVGVVPSRAVVGSDVAVLVALGAGIAVATSIIGGRNRVLRRSLLFVVGGSALLATTAYIVARLTGVSQIQVVFSPGPFGTAAVAGSIAFYLGVLAIERRAIAQAAADPDE